LKKLMLLTAMLAMVLAVAVPAIAQVGFGQGQGTDDTGDVALETAVESTGNNGNQCVAPIQFGSTGSFQNTQSFLQYDSILEEAEFDAGDGFSMSPAQEVACDQKVQQAAAASSNK
jgi:hypothetical protein